VNVSTTSRQSKARILVAEDEAKRHAEERLRIHLRKRHKITDWESSMIEFPRRVLYEKHGLYKLSTVTGWKKAHASV
jgi:RNA-directed DNA polymerase